MMMGQNTHTHTHTIFSLGVENERAGDRRGAGWLNPSHETKIIRRKNEDRENTIYAPCSGDDPQARLATKSLDAQSAERDG